VSARGDSEPGRHAALGDSHRISVAADDAERGVTAPQVVLMCGLPASGKTTTAARLHAGLGGTLIRSCDVYQALGISLPYWVQRTQGFTRETGAYERLRDAAYVEMARQLAWSLQGGATMVIVDAVHGERAKRHVVYEICARHGGAPILVWCRCDDAAEVARRMRARRGRESSPEHEASDLSVFRHISGLWEDPTSDQLGDGRAVATVIYDTRASRASLVRGAPSRLVDRIHSALQP
jgi:predicted kinase